MVNQITNSFMGWVDQIQAIVGQQLSHMSPHGYCTLLVFVISIGYVLLKGRS